MYDTQALRRPINLTANADLLAKARALNINLSAIFEQALAEALRIEQRRRWLAENQAAIEAYNAQVEERGVFSDGLRSF